MDQTTSAAANRPHWRLPDEPLRSSALGTQLVGWVAIGIIAIAARLVLPLGPLYPLKTFAVFAVVVACTLRALADHHPFATFGLANGVTTARAVLVSLVAGLIGEPGASAAAAAGAGVLVAVLDGVDGWAARRTGMASSFGARFDMEIDALHIMVTAVLAWQYGKAGAWILLSGLLRYMFVAGGWLWPWLARPLPSSWRRQSICVAQVVTLIVVVSPVVAPPASTALAAGALALLGYSFLVDTAYLWTTGQVRS